MGKIDISFKRIQQLALPAIVAGIAEPILSSTDAAVVGNLPTLSTQSLAAVGIVGAFLTMLIWVLSQTRSAISAIISQNLGAGKLDLIKTFPAQAICFNLLTSVILIGGTYWFVEDIFKLLNASGVILELSIDYYNIRVWGFPFTLIAFAIFGIFRGLQNTFWPMVVATSGVVINIILDFMLVYGVEGLIDPMGVKGAAWASLIAQLLMALLAIFLLIRKTSVSLKLHLPLHPEIRRLVLMSFNLFLRTIALNIALILAVREATALGDEAIAAHTILINIWLFSAFFIDGYGAAGNALGGRLLGAKNYPGLWLLTKRVMSYNLIIAGLLMGAGWIGYRAIGALFINESAVLDIYYSVFYIIILMQPLNTIAFTLDAIFKGLGETAYLRNTLLVATFLGFVPAIFLSRYLDWQITGIWIAFCVWMLIRASALVVKYYTTYYRLAKSA